MPQRWRCRHGHEVAVAESDAQSSADVICPLCGSICPNGATSDTHRGNFAETIEFGSASQGSDDIQAAGSSCPSYEQLAAYGSGKLSAELIDAVAAHLDGCRECGTVVDAMDEQPDSLVRQLRLRADSPVSEAGGSAELASLDMMSDQAGSRYAAVPSSEKARTPPSIAGHQVLCEIGQGGMGIVYQARELKHQRDVALKTLLRMNPSRLQAFKQEFRALADVAHPNLISLYELVSDGQTWCFTMELLTGVNFLEYVWSGFNKLAPETNPAMTSPAMTSNDIAASRLSPAQIKRLKNALKQLALGLHALHQAGMLHRDLKPSNVLMTTERRLVVLDFGLVGELQSEADERRYIVGTPEYMSPEQAACTPVAEASDWYAVGVMLYEVLAGRLPFVCSRIEQVIRKQQQIPTSPRQLDPTVPCDLSDLCMALLDRDPEKRPSALDVLRYVGAAELAGSLRLTSPGGNNGFELVGRQRQLGRLETAFRHVQRGDAHSVFVQGASGMGKSVLIQRFLGSIKHSKAAVVLHGRCHQQESVPFKALDSLIDSLAIYLRSVDEEQVRSFAPDDSAALIRLFPVLGDILQRSETELNALDNVSQPELRQRASDVLRELLRRIGSRTPVVLSIDDLQWGDEDSAELLAGVMRSPDAPRALLLGAYRSEDADKSRCLLAIGESYAKQGGRLPREDLIVDSLSVEEASHLALMLLGSDDETARWQSRMIAQESGGWPFFVWELVQHVQEDPEVADQSLELDDVIWARVSRLPQETRRLLELVAVAGRPMPETIVYQALNAVSEGPSLLGQLRAGNFVRTSEGSEGGKIVETYHDRIRESVVDHLGVQTVQGHLLSLAMTIEHASGIDFQSLQTHIDRVSDDQKPDSLFQLEQHQWQQVFDLAYFFDTAGSHERALPYALVAAERAHAQNALEVAEQQYRIALVGAQAAHPSLSFRIREGLGNVLMLRGGYDEAERQFSEALDIARGHAARSRIEGRFGDLAFRQGDMRRAAEHFERALKTIGDPPPKTAVGLVASLAKEAVVQLLHTYLPSWFVARRRTGTKPFLRDMFRAGLHNGLCHPYWYTKGPVPLLWAHLRHMNLAERYAPTEELGIAYALHAITMTAIPLARRGIAYADKSYGIHLERGDLIGQGRARSYQTFAYLVLAQFAKAVDTGREAVRLMEQAGDVWQANMARIIASYPSYHLGDLRHAARQARLAYEIAKDTDDYSGMAIALWFLALSSPDTVPVEALQTELARPRQDPLASAGVILGQGLQLLRREKQPEHAARVLDDSLVVAKRHGLRNVCLFEAVTWKSTALRMVAEQKAQGPERRQSLRVSKRAVRDALKITKSYRACRPHALRERALLAVLEQEEAQARRFFDESLRLAEQHAARYEHAKSLLARGEAGLQFNWPESDIQISQASATIYELEMDRD